MLDRIEKVGNSWIQHGKQSDRVYLMKLDSRDMPEILSEIDALAKAGDYGKLFLKVPWSAAQACVDHGCRTEAFVPKFYEGAEGAAFMGKYLKDARAEMDDLADICRVLEIAKKRESSGRAYCLPPEYSMRQLRPGDAEKISTLYGEVFQTYPFPIHDPEFIRRTMKENVFYFGVFSNQRLLGVASSETDPAGLNVEMTDFATSPECQGKGFARSLLQTMEAAMRERGMLTAYTIARAHSQGMNITFADMGYEFAGTLPNNTNISGSIQSMNVWYKDLAGDCAGDLG